MRNLLTLFGLMVALAACGGGAVVSEAEDSEEQEALGGCVWTGPTLGWYCKNDGPSCGALGGDYCYNGGSKPPLYDNLGATYDCQECLRLGPSCGELRGDYCYNGGGYPSGYGSLGPSRDCQLCLVHGESDQPE